MIKFLLSTGAIVGIVIAAVVVLLIIILVAAIINCYNKLVKAKNRVDNQWAQIDVQVKRRFDLIPNLVETVKGYAKHESDIFGAFAKARQTYADASKAQSAEGVAKADSELTKALNVFVNAVKEEYPEIKADSHFLKLQEDLKDCEDKIAYQRQFYNDVVLSFNNLRAVFPNVIIANMFGFKEREYFKTTDEVRENAPKVSF